MAAAGALSTAVSVIAVASFTGAASVTVVVVVSAAAAGSLLVSAVVTTTAGASVAEALLVVLVPVAQAAPSKAKPTNEPTSQRVCVKVDFIIISTFQVAMLNSRPGPIIAQHYQGLLWEMSRNSPGNRQRTVVCLRGNGQVA